MGDLSVTDLVGKERSLAAMIPYSHHVSKFVIATKKGEYVSCIRLVGRSHISADEYDVNRWVENLNTLVRSIPGQDLEHTAFYVHTVRRKEVALQDKIFTNTFSHNLLTKYNTNFSKESLMVNEIYLTIVYRPTVNKVIGIFSRFEKMSLEQRIEQQKGYIQRINRITGLMLRGLRAYEPSLLKTYTHNNRMYCRILEFFAYLITHKRVRVPVSRERYYNYLSTDRLLFSEHGEIGEIRHIDGSKFFGMIEIKEYSDITAPGHFNALLHADCEMVVTQSFSIISKTSALGYLKRHKKLLVDSEDVAVSQINQMDVALDELMSGAFVMGEHHMTVCAYADSPQQVRGLLQGLTSDFTDTGVIPTFIDNALEAGFFAQLPGNFALRPRPAVITSQNFWSFNSLHNYMTGKAHGNPWGEAITMFKSLSGSPYFFNFHRSPKDENSIGKKYDGNTLLFGKTGSGKTTLAAFMFAQALSIPGLRLVAFDKDEGLSIFIRSVGGMYLPLKTGKPTGFNPLQMPDTPENRKFIKQWIHQLITGDEMGKKYGISYQDEEEINKAIDIIYRHEQANRKLSVFVQSLPNPLNDDETRPTVRQRLGKWFGKGNLAWVFDNAEDSLDTTKYNVYGFDVTDFLDDEELRSTIIMYLTYRTQQMIDGRPFIYYFDEFWKLILDAFFQYLFLNKLKTIRKENGICVFASQEPDDALKSPLARTMVSQCATQILLENPKASYEEYVEGLKLSPEEFNLVKNIPDKSYQFLVKQGNGETTQSAMLRFHLPNFDKEMLVLSGTPDNADMVRDIIARVGTNDPDVWLPEFYETHGFSKDGAVNNIA